jgi:hypothetical protein
LIQIIAIFDANQSGYGPETRQNYEIFNHPLDVIRVTPVIVHHHNGFDQQQEDGFYAGIRAA